MTDRDLVFALTVSLANCKHMLSNLNRATPAPTAKGRLVDVMDPFRVCWVNDVHLVSIKNLGACSHE